MLDCYTVALCLVSSFMPAQSGCYSLLFWSDNTLHPEGNGELLPLRALAQQHESKFCFASNIILLIK